MPYDPRNAPRGYYAPQNAYNVAGVARQVAGGMPLDNRPMVKQDLWGRDVRQVRPALDRPNVRHGEGSRARETYRFIKNVGVGGQASCDLYERQSSKELLVCKVMKHVPKLDSRGKPWEITILNSVLSKHPNVIGLLGFSPLVQKGMIFWFEYCNAGDLQDVIDAHIRRGKSPPEAFIWHCYLQLAEAMAYIHAGYRVDGQPISSNFQTVIHRDIKPSNIFLRRSRSQTQYPDLVVADFGMATTQKYSGQGSLLGTPIYQPPECPLHSREGDIWAVGACIHALATGGPPMAQPPRGVTDNQWFLNPGSRVMADVRSFGYSRDLYDALFWVLRVKPDNRFSGDVLYKKVVQGRRQWKGRFEAHTGLPAFYPLAEWAVKHH
ncbi:MAG: hypothetical protein Q9222_005027 [Ikaeria aurantiellina]